MIDVAFTKDGLGRCDVAVVIDALRATSTVTTALAGDYRRVLCAGSIEQARDLAAPDRVIAGERHCVKPAGFDLGNSPRQVAERTDGDRVELVLASTNGTPAVLAAARLARVVLLGCLLNLDAVFGAVMGVGRLRATTVTLVCSGTDGAPALEDTYVAGLLSAALPGERSDAALMAEAVARGCTDARRAFRDSLDGRRLAAGGMEADIAFCARHSVLDVVPAVVVTDLGVAVVEPWDISGRAPAPMGDTVVA